MCCSRRLRYGGSGTTAVGVVNDIEYLRRGSRHPDAWRGLYLGYAAAVPALCPRLQQQQQLAEAPQVGPRDRSRSPQVDVAATEKRATVVDHDPRRCLLLLLLRRWTIAIVQLSADSSTTIHLRWNDNVLWRCPSRHWRDTVTMIAHGTSEQTLEVKQQVPPALRTDRQSLQINIGVHSMSSTATTRASLHVNVNWLIVVDHWERSRLRVEFADL